MARLRRKQQSKRLPFIGKRAFGVLRKGKNILKDFYKHSMDVPFLRTAVSKAINGIPYGGYAMDGLEILGDTIDMLAKSK